MRETYEIEKAEVSAYYSGYGQYYEVNVWFKGIGKTVCTVSPLLLQQQADVIRGKGFKKIQAYLNTEEGKKWLSATLKEKDLENEKNKLKDSIKWRINKMDLPELCELEKFSKMLLDGKSPVKEGV